MASAESLVSIVTPTYNRHELLPHAVQSITQQTYPHWELIIVDDGSTDDTQAYLSSLDDPRLRSVLRDHCGNIAAVRNTGIHAAKGAFIGFLDSDDFVMHDSLEQHVRQLRLHPERGWSHGHHQLVDASGKNIGARIEGPKGNSRDDVLRDVITDRAVPHTGAVLVRRTVLDQVGLFDETLPFAEDFDLWLRLARVAPSVAIDATLVKVREHTGRTTGQNPNMALGKAMSLAKFKETVNGEDIRGLCDRMRGEHLIRHAAGLSRRNHSVQAMRTLMTAARLRGVPSVWWKELAKVFIRPLIGHRTSRKHLQH